MNGLKVKALVAAIIVAGAALVATLTFGKTSAKGAASATQAGAALLADYNAGTQQARAVKVLRCLQGSNSSYLCAVAVTPDGSSVICTKFTGRVAAGVVSKLTVVQADPAVCYFAS